VVHNHGRERHGLARLAQLLADAGKPDEPVQVPTAIAETILGMSPMAGHNPRDK
jgi:hypothetical protein